MSKRPDKTFYDLLHDPKIAKAFEPHKVEPRSNIEYYIAERLMAKLAIRAYPELEGIDMFDNGMTSRLYKELDKVGIKDNAAELINGRFERALDQVIAAYFGESRILN